MTPLKDRRTPVKLPRKVRRRSGPDPPRSPDPRAPRRNGPEIRTPRRSGELRTPRSPDPREPKRNGLELKTPRRSGPELRTPKSLNPPRLKLSPSRKRQRRSKDPRMPRSGPELRTP